MRKLMLPVHGLTIAMIVAAFPAHAATLQSAAEALGAITTKSIEYSGTGRWFQFGQAPSPTTAWPQFDVSSFTTAINYETSGAHVQLTRKQTIEAKRQRPAPTEQKPDQFVSGSYAWNLVPPANASSGAASVASSQSGSVAERNAEILSTPQGFLRAALTNNASAKLVKGATEVSFTIDGKYRYVGIINAKNQVERIKTWIDTPVLGDTLTETRYSGYKDFGGIQFPAHIVRLQGGYPVLDINVSEVRLNPVVDIAVPKEVVSAKAPAINVAVSKLADGVYYLTGGTHHSVVIEQKDHVVVVEAPLNEERSLAVIAKVKELIPNKQIKFLINTHAHFDHSGGLRTYVDAGAMIVTHQSNKAYYQKIWAAPHTINPDLLAASKKTAHFDTFNGKHVLTDGQRSIEIYPVAGSGHNDAFALVYLPAEKVLIEADAYTPLPANAPAPTSLNPYSVNLYENVRKLKLDVNQIAALHGPGVVTLTDLRKYIGQVASN